MNIVITGSSRGIGLQLTKCALENGDQVVAIARRPEESDALLALQKKFSKSLRLLAAELTETAAPDNIANALQTWAQVDVLINNAGMYIKGETSEDFKRIFHLNSVVPYLLTKALLPKLRQAQSPRVAQITSLMGSIKDNASGGSEAYRASKAALNMLNKCLAVENEWLATAVIHPGWVKTDMGGPGAPTEPEESAAGIWTVVRSLSTKQNGAFFDFRGKELPW